MGPDDTRDFIQFLQAFLVAGICAVTTYLIVGDD